MKKLLISTYFRIAIATCLAAESVGGCVTTVALRGITGCCTSTSHSPAGGGDWEVANGTACGTRVSREEDLFRLRVELLSGEDEFLRFIGGTEVSVLDALFTDLLQKNFIVVI